MPRGETQARRAAAPANAAACIHPSSRSHPRPGGGTGHAAPLGSRPCLPAGRAGGLASPVLPPPSAAPFSSSSSLPPPPPHPHLSRPPLSGSPRAVWRPPRPRRASRESRGCRRRRRHRRGGGDTRGEPVTSGVFLKVNNEPGGGGGRSRERGPGGSGVSAPGGSRRRRRPPDPAHRCCGRAARPGASLRSGARSSM